MGFKITTVIPAKNTGGSAFKPVDVPEDVAAELAELYKYLRDHTSERARAAFDTVEERKTFVKQAKSWALAEDLRFRVTKPSEELPETEIQFFILPPFTEEEIAANKADAERRKAKKAEKAEKAAAEAAAASGGKK